MRKKRLALDFDDCVVNSSEIFLELLNHHYGTSLIMEQMIHFEFEKHFGISRDELNQRWLEFDANRYQGKITLLPGARDMIMRLSAERELHIITNRPSSMVQSTLELIQAYIPNAVEDVHFCTRPDTLRTYRTKSSVCKHIGAHILVEDHPQNAHICAADSVHVYLMEQPWNKGHEFPLYPGIIVPVRNWHDPILETLFR